MENKICPECGKQLARGAILCINCGALLSRIGGSEPEQIIENVTVPDAGDLTTIFAPEPKNYNQEIDTTGRQQEKKNDLNGYSGMKSENPKSIELKNNKNKNKKEKRRKKRAKWPIFLIFVFLMACFAAGLFLSDEDNRAWIMNHFNQTEAESYVDVDELAQKNIDIYDLYGKNISDVKKDLGNPLSTMQKEDDELGSLTEYDYGLFVLESNKVGTVVSAQIDYSSLEDNTSVLAYTADGSMLKDTVTSTLGNPNSNDSENHKIFYYPEDTTVVRYTFDDQQVMTQARVYYDKNAVAGVSGEGYDSVFETTEWIGRYKSACEALLGTSRDLGSNSYGGSTYYVDGVTLDTNDLDVICRIEIDYSSHTSNNKLLVSNLFYGYDKETMLEVMGMEAEQSGKSYTFTKGATRLIYLLDSSDKILTAVIESIN